MLVPIRVTPIARVVNGIMAALLIVFAVVQLNDPDPVFWVALYLLCAAVPLLALFGHRSRPLLGASILFCVVAMVITAGGALEYLPRAGEESLLQDMSPDKPYIEETRELIGAAIALSLVIVATIVCRGPGETRDL